MHPFYHNVMSPMETAPRDGTRIVLHRNGRRYVGEYDEDSGYFFIDVALDGVEPGNECPGRLYGVEGWSLT